MAVLKLSALVTSIKGKSGGTVFQGSVTGQVMKNNVGRRNYGMVLPAFNASAPQQTNMRLQLPTAARAWRALTDVQREAWNTAAPDFPFINRYGEPYTGSGFQLFVQQQTANAVLGVPFSTDPPVPEVAPDPPLYTIDVYNVGGTNLNMASAIPSGYVLQLEFSPNLSSGVRASNKSRRIVAQLPDTTVFPYNINPIIPSWLIDRGGWTSTTPVATSGKITKADAARAVASSQYTWFPNFP